MLDVLLALIRPRQACAIMDHLAPAVPLNGLQHLKRLRKLPKQEDGQPAMEVLLCPLPSEQQPPTAGGATTFCAWSADSLAAAGAPDAVVQLTTEQVLPVRRAQVGHSTAAPACMHLTRAGL